MTDYYAIHLPARTRITSLSQCGERSSSPRQNSPNARECKTNYVAERLQNATLCPPALLRITLDPVLRVLLKLLAVLPVLVGDGGLDSIVWVRLDQERLDQAQHRHNLVWWLPLVGAEQAQAHGALVIVAHVGMVDLGSEADDRGLEWVFVGKDDFELEVTALRGVSSRSSRATPLAASSNVQRRQTDLARP
jgi:hypothetical protein